MKLSEKIVIANHFFIFLVFLFADRRVLTLMHCLG